MSIEARKIGFIQEFLKLQSEDAISKLEKLLLKEKSQSGNRKIEPMLVQELNSRIDKSGLLQWIPSPIFRTFVNVLGKPYKH